jgi:hypothetical protein
MGAVMKRLILLLFLICSPALVLATQLTLYPDQNNADGNGYNDLTWVSSDATAQVPYKILQVGEKYNAHYSFLITLSTDSCAVDSVRLSLVNMRNNASTTYSAKVTVMDTTNSYVINSLTKYLNSYAKRYTTSTASIYKTTGIDSNQVYSALVTPLFNRFMANNSGTSNGLRIQFFIHDNPDTLSSSGAYWYFLNYENGTNKPKLDIYYHLTSSTVIDGSYGRQFVDLYNRRKW